MKYIVKNKLIIIISKNQRIIINFNDNKNEMALNTFVSLKKIIDNNFKHECYIININRYFSACWSTNTLLLFILPSTTLFSDFCKIY